MTGRTPEERLRAAEEDWRVAKQAWADAREAALAADAELTTAAADGVYDRGEATPLRAHVQRLRESLDWLDGLLAEAEARGARGVA